MLRLVAGLERTRSAGAAAKVPLLHEDFVILEAGLEQGLPNAQIRGEKSSQSISMRRHEDIESSL